MRLAVNPASVVESYNWVQIAMNNLENYGRKLGTLQSGVRNAFGDRDDVDDILDKSVDGNCSDNSSADIGCADIVKALHNYYRHNACWVSGKVRTSKLVKLHINKKLYKAFSSKGLPVSNLVSEFSDATFDSLSQEAPIDSPRMARVCKSFSFVQLESPDHGRNDADTAASVDSNYHEATSNVRFLKRIHSVLSKHMFQGKFKLVPHKMNWYTAGCFFNPIDDAPLEHDHMGTVVIGLPSTHTGGGLKLEDGDTSEVIDFASFSKDPNHAMWVAFRGHVRHEVLPVTSGNLLTVSYSIMKVHDAVNIVTEATLSASPCIPDFTKSLMNAPRERTSFSDEEYFINRDLNGTNSLDQSPSMIRLTPGLNSEYSQDVESSIDWMERRAIHSSKIQLENLAVDIDKSEGYRGKFVLGPEKSAEEKIEVLLTAINSSLGVIKTIGILMHHLYTQVTLSTNQLKGSDLTLYDRLIADTSLTVWLTPVACLIDSTKLKSTTNDVYLINDYEMNYLRTPGIFPSRRDYPNIPSEIHFFADNLGELATRKREGSQNSRMSDTKVYFSAAMLISKK